MVSFSVSSSLVVLTAILFVVADGKGDSKKGGGFHNQPHAQGDLEWEFPPEILTKEEMGPRDRFWKHNNFEQKLEHKGTNYHQRLKNCIQETMGDDYSMVKRVTNHAIRKPGRTINDPYNNDIPMIMSVENAIHPIHVKAVQTLAKCVRKHLPHLYESRAMYQEMNLDEDDGSGGNCPTHLAPLVGLYFPEVVDEMYATVRTAYNAIPGWQDGVAYDQANEFLPREKKMYPPEEVGIRASEHLTYTDFPRLKEHHDGDTVFTLNFAFSAPEDYKGGEFFILSQDLDSDDEFRDTIKPNQYAALVFLGGQYMHGVEEIYGGHREMFSTELWAYPDTPFGSNLWSNYPGNMEDYVERCNAQQAQTGSSKCTLPYDLSTPFMESRDAVREKYGDEVGDSDEFDDGHHFQDDEHHRNNMHHNMHDGDQEFYDEEDEDDDDWQNHQYDYDKSEKDAHGMPLAPPFPGIDRMTDNKLRPNRVRPSSLKPMKVIFGDGTGNQFDLDDFYSFQEEPDFLVPKKLEAGELMPIRWREDLTPVDGSDGESLLVGFPPELHEEFKKYVANSGMMRVAHSILYKEEPLEPGDQRIYTLDDGEKWTAMVQGSWDTDMVWLDPGDESCFESLLGILRRGNFDKVLDQVGKAFDLDGLMVQGVGAIFLTEYTKTENMHVDIPGSRGSFYNIIVPVHIPADDVAIFKISDKGDDFQGKIRLDPNVGVVLGGESRHGTGECNYRKNQDFRLSFAVYVADINDENIEVIASDSTSLWPTSGDTFFFEAQKGRLWTRDGRYSLKNDRGRLPMNIQDNHPRCATMDKNLCMTDVQGVRLACPKTCELYLEDDVYYAKFFPNQTAPNQNPTCASQDDPSCVATVTA